MRDQAEANQQFDRLVSQFTALDHAVRASGFLLRDYFTVADLNVASGFCLLVAAGVRF